MVIDYSSPNVAKQMHVGHLRGTIIGDCLNRVLTAVGHTVLPQSHIGDWGTQFGMLVEQVLDEGVDVKTMDLPAAEQLYTRAVDALQDRPDFRRDGARRGWCMLQAGDEQTMAIWHDLVDISLAGFNDTYARMNVRLTDDHVAGESMYNHDLAVGGGRTGGQRHGGDRRRCLCACSSRASPRPMIVRKSDGGFGYAATDLAAVRHRVRDLKANRMIYVTDVRQADHFALVFAVARKAGYLPEDVRAEHVGFGMVLGTDGKPFKTREGKAMRLAMLLDAAEEQTSPPVALAAVKYADLSTGINKDYVFDIDRMVQTTGNTGPYLQYAHARLAQVLRRAEAEGLAEQTKITVLEEPAEQTLALLLTRFGEVVAEVADTLQPHRLCTYLYELAGALSIFYEQCPVLKSEGEVRDSRLALCAATKAVLATGLDLLGIEPLDRM